MSDPAPTPRAARTKNLLRGFASSWLSVLHRTLGPIDDEHFDRPSLRVQLQSELLLHRGEDGWTVRIDVHAVEADRLIRGRAGCALRHLVRRPLEISVVVARQAGPVKHDPADEHSQAVRE